MPHNGFEKRKKKKQWGGFDSKEGAEVKPTSTLYVVCTKYIHIYMQYSDMVFTVDAGKCAYTLYMKFPYTEVHSFGSFSHSYSGIKIQSGILWCSLLGTEVESFF